MTLRTIIISGAITFLAGALVFGQHDTFDSASFNALSEAEKTAFVLTVLQDRESQLQNFSYEMTDRLRNITKDGAEKEIFSEASMGLKRKGRKLYFESESLDSQKQLRRYYVRWDGLTSKSLVNRPYRAQNDVVNGGVIKDSEDRNFMRRGYNHVLGLRTQTSNDLTLPGWFEDAKAKGKPIGINFLEQDGKPLIALKVMITEWKYLKWLLDVSRDYMPVSAEIRYQKGASYNSAAWTVEEAIEVDGFWVPKKVIQIGGTSVADEETKVVYEISKFTRNTVTDKDFEINYPPGTEVVDKIANSVYRVLPAGGYEPLPFYDSATGEVIDRRISIDQAPSELPEGTNDQKEPAKKTTTPGESPTPTTPTVSPEAESAPTATPDVKRSPWLGISAIVIGGLLVLLGLKFVITRH